MPVSVDAEHSAPSRVRRPGHSDLEPRRPVGTRLLAEYFGLSNSECRRGVDAVERRASEVLEGKSYAPLIGFFDRWRQCSEVSGSQFW